MKFYRHPLYKQFVERYAFDIVRFAIEVCNTIPTQQQIDLMRSVAYFGSRTSVSSGHGCFGIDTEIMMNNGSIKPVQDVAVGDVLMGDDGQSGRNVLALYRGRENMYRFTYNDGTSHTFNESHILCLVATNSKGRRKAGDKTTVTVRDWLTWGEDKKRCHAVYRSPAIDFSRSASKMLIPPYILGVWLGDGSSNSTEITTMDEEIVEEWRGFSDSLGYSLTEKNRNTGKASSYHIASNIPKNNKFRRELIRLGVLGNKHIPDEYLYSSFDDRMDLLAGLIDTDGAKDNKGYDFVQKNKRLAMQVQWLARSVGCHSVIKKCVKKCCNTGATGDYWRVTIGRNTEKIPVRIKRKKIDNPAKQRGNLHFGIRSVEPLGEGDYYGFELDGNHKFLGGDFTVLHNTGKTRSIAVISLWHLLCYERSNTMLTAPKIEQVRNLVWKEIATIVDEARAAGRFDFIFNEATGYLVVEATRVYIRGNKDNWFVIAKTAPRGQPENLAGAHGKYYIVIADEASGIPDNNYGVLMGALTDDRNRALLTSQPTRASGFFYQTHHELSKKNGGTWENITMSSIDSPLVGSKFIIEKQKAYTKEQFQVKVLGQFPENISGMLTSREDIQKCFTRGRIIKPTDPYGWFLSVDIGGGEGRDFSVATLIRVMGSGGTGDNPRKMEIVDIPIYSNDRNIHNFLGDVINEWRKHDETIITPVDVMGLGHGAPSFLESASMYNIYKVRWGKPCFLKENADLYNNLVAQAHVSLQRAIKDGRVSFLTEKYKDKILGEGSRIPYEFDNQFRYKIVSKDKRAEMGIPSPDIWDTFAFAFLEGLNYNVHSNYTNNTESLDKERTTKISSYMSRVADIT